MTEHNHSLVIISNFKLQEERSFLVYYDERWDCKLFLNYKTQDRDNEAFLMNRVSAELLVDKSQIAIRYVAAKIQEKYSVSHAENRVYHHELYEMQVNDWSEDKQSDFTINGRHYYWMTIYEMEMDSDIMKKNKEVVEFVKEMFP